MDTETTTKFNVSTVQGRITMSASWSANANYFECLLDDTDDVNLLNAVMKLDGIQFLDQELQKKIAFEFSDVEGHILNDMEWAMNEEEPLRSTINMIGADRAAAIRFWTGGHICLLINDLLRSDNMENGAINHALPFLKLLYSALHLLPGQFHYEGELFRVEYQPPSFDPKWPFGFFTPTSFLKSAEHVEFAKKSGFKNTVYEIPKGFGYCISAFSRSQNETSDEVLVEGVALVDVMDNFGTQPSEQCCYLTCHVRPGVSMLSGSPARHHEEKIYTARMKVSSDTDPLVALKDLNYDPFDPDEWVQRDPRVNKATDNEKIRSQLGMGAFGKIFRMRRRGTSERYAVKVVKRRNANFQGLDVERMREEAKVMWRLRHRNVVALYGDISTEDALFLVMSLANGGSLDKFIQRCEGSPMAEATAWTMLRQLAAALEYIHGEGVLHRDIKPHNMLLDTSPSNSDFGGSVGGNRDLTVLKLCDFGLSCVMRSSCGGLSSSFTQTKVGTGLYSSPEKLDGRPYGAADDMWGVGCVLGEMLTGTLLARSLRDAGTQEQLIQEAREVSPQLAVLLTGLLASKRHQRYSARQLGILLDTCTSRLLGRESPQGEVVGSAGGLSRKRHADHAFSVGGSYRQSEGAVGVSLRLAPTAMLKGHKNCVRCVAFSNDSTLLASASEDHTVRIWRELTDHLSTSASPPVFDLMKVLEGHKNVVYSMSFEPGGSLLATGSQDATLRLWGGENFSNSLELRAQSAGVSCLAFSRNRRVATGSWDNTVMLWSCEKTQASSVGSTSEIGEWVCAASPLLHTGMVWSVSFSPDGLWLATGSNDMMLRVWGGADHNVPVLELGGLGGPLCVVAFSGNGKVLACGGRDKVVRLWGWTDLEDDVRATVNGAAGVLRRAPPSRELQHNGAVEALAFDGGNLLATGSADGQVLLLENCGLGNCVSKLEGHTRQILGLAFGREGRFLATASTDHKVGLWDLSPALKIIT